MKNPKVLIVEDIQLNIELATDILKLKGWDVMQAKSAEEGIEIAKKQPPDIILMDISLPGMDGLEATKILKENSNTQNVPVIALTAHAMRGDKQKAMDAGCNGYISKPIDTRSFAGTVAEHLKKINCHKELL